MRKQDWLSFLSADRPTILSTPSSRVLRYRTIVVRGILLAQRATGAARSSAGRRSRPRQRICKRDSADSAGRSARLPMGASELIAVDTTSPVDVHELAFEVRAMLAISARGA